MSDVMNVTDDTFEEEILKSDIPAMVDFWAEWCGPCKMVSPVVEELAKMDRWHKRSLGLTLRATLTRK